MKRTDLSRNGAKLLALVLLLVQTAAPATAAKQAKQSAARKSSGQKDDPGCQSCLSQAASLFASQDTNAAAALLRQWSPKCPGNSQIHLLLSTILIRQGEKNLAEAQTEAEAACRAQDDNQAAHLQLAMVLMAQEKFSAAAAEFETVSKLNPASYEAWSCLADVYKRLRQDDQAKTAAQKAAALEPATQNIKLSVLRNLKKAGKLAAAKNELKSLIKASGDLPELQQQLSVEALQLGAYDEAIESAQSVIAAYPDSKNAHSVLLFANLLKNQFEAALRQTEKLDQSKGYTAELLAIRGICKLKLAQTGEANQDIEKAYSQDPSQAFCMLAAGLAKLASGNFEEAETLLKSASEAQTKGTVSDRIPQSLAQLSLASLNRKQGLLSESAQDARAAGQDKRFAASALALEARVKIADQSGSDTLTQSQNLLRQALSLDPSDPEVITANSYLQLRSGKTSEAKVLAESALKLAPGNSDILLLLSEIAESQQNSSQQKSLLEAGLKLSSKDPELLYQLGRLYLKENKYTDALPLLKQAEEGTVRSPQICLALAQACEKSGQSGESLKYYKKSLQQGLPENAAQEARAALSRLETEK